MRASAGELSESCRYAHAPVHASVMFLPRRHVRSLGEQPSLSANRFDSCCISRFWSTAAHARELGQPAAAVAARTGQRARTYGLELQRDRVALHDGAVVEALARWRHHVAGHCAQQTGERVSERVHRCQRPRREAPRTRRASSRLAKDRDVRGVSAKGGNVLLDPL